MGTVNPDIHFGPLDRYRLKQVEAKQTELADQIDTKVDKDDFQLLRDDMAGARKTLHGYGIAIVSGIFTLTGSLLAILISHVH